MTPVRRCVPCREVAADGDVGVHCHEIADVAGADHLDDGPIEREGVRRGDDLRGEVGVCTRRLEHRVSLGCVHRHPCLAEHVLARFQRGDGDRRVQVWPRADAHRVDAVVFDDLEPVVRDPRNAEFARGALAGFPRSVGDRDDLDPRLLLQARDVELPCVGAGADDTDAKHGRF